MTEDQKVAIASLKHSHAYNMLLDHLDEEVAGMLGELEVAETPVQVLRLTRLWQVARRLVDRLRFAPEAMDQVIKEEMGRTSAEATLLGEDDDIYSRPVPPTSTSYNLSAKI